MQSFSLKVGRVGNICYLIISILLWYVCFYSFLMKQDAAPYHHELVFPSTCGHSELFKSASCCLLLISPYRGKVLKGHLEVSTPLDLDFTFFSVLPFFFYSLLTFPEAPLLLCVAD